MRSGVLAALAAALVLSACASEPSGDPELSIYLSAPLSGPRAADGRDIADGARLALADAGAEAAGTAVSLSVLDDAGPDGWEAALTASNARRATEDSSAIAFLGELDSGATRTSLPITNEAGILQVSPGSGAEDLTREVPGSSQVPSLVQPTGSRTFGRVIPSDVAQAEAGAAWMADLGVQSVEIVEGEEPFAASLREGLESVSDAPPITTESPDAIYVAKADLGGPDRDLPVFTESGSIFGPDALLERRDLAVLEALLQACPARGGCPEGPRRAPLTSAALDPLQLPPDVDGGFLFDFRDEYGREPGRYAAYGYEAMAVTLDAIERAEDPLERASVVDAFFATDERESVLGIYSIDEVGDTTLGQIGAYEVIDGRAEPLSGPLQRP